MGSYKEHQRLIGEFTVLVQNSIKNARFFERHVGKFILTRFIDDVLKKRASFSDWCRYLISINMVGMADGYILIPTRYGLIHVEVEAKTGEATQTKEQKIWQKYIERSGGIYILLRDKQKAVDELLEKIKHIM